MAGNSRALDSEAPSLYILPWRAAQTMSLSEDE